VLPTLLAAAAAALAPRAVDAQDDPRLARRLDPATRAVVARLVDSARVAGIPTEPLVDKALEGASKQAGGDRIADAVRALALDLAHARALLGADASVGEVVSAARALRAGVSPALLERFGRERARRPMTVALAVLGELVARGVPPDSAAGAVLALAAGGANDGELVAYQQGVEQGARIGAPPAPLGLPRGTGRDAGDAVTGAGGGAQSMGAPPPPPTRPTPPKPRRPRP
jgi:hypothetical protein